MAEPGPTTDATSVIAQSPQEPEVSAASSLPFAALAGGSAAGPAGVRQLARRSAGDRAAVIGALSHGAGNAAVARMLGAAAGPRVLQRDEFPPAAPATSAPAAAPASAAPAAGSPGADPATDPAADQAKSETWQHPEVRQRAVPIEAAPAKAAPKDRGLDLYVQLVPSVVRAVKGYSTADGDQIPLENAMLIIAQGTAEHAPYDPGLANKPVIPAGNMLWGITSPSTSTATTKTTTTEVKDGVRGTEHDRAFRAYDTLDEAAMGYLKALEGVDPDAAKNPAYPSILAALKKPGLSPDEFGAVLQSAGYATEPDYGAKIAKNAKEGDQATAKRLVKKFMPQILAGQQEKIDGLKEKLAAYVSLLAWIDQRISAVKKQLEDLASSSEQTVALKEELRQMELDRPVVEERRRKLEPLVVKEQQLLADIREFGSTIGAPGATP